MTEQEAVPAGYGDRLYNEDLAPAKERRWGSYSIFALWMSDVHNLGNYTFVIGSRTSGAVRGRPLLWL
jgi:nucleobase:cation symporter-1, NCS1 family